MMSVPKQMRGKVKGIRTNRHTNKEREVEIEYEIKKKDDKYWVYIIDGGVTGFESAPITDPKGYPTIMSPCQDNCIGWIACMGTTPIGTAPGWDRLVIPCKEMDKIRSHARNLGIV
jgi:hypothetical protein